MLEADGACTKIHLKGGTHLLVRKKIKVFEDVLSGRRYFSRPHRSFLVNLNYIRKYSRGESMITMDSGFSMPISRDKKQDFENLLKELKITV